MSESSLRPDTILLVEDDPDDRLMAKEALEESGVHNRLQFAEDGEEALDFLLGRGRFEQRGGRRRPGLILLDLNMPRKDGRDVLRELKTDPALRQIPVVVLTTSRSVEDIAGSYHLGANSFITKPMTFTGLVDTLKQVCSYWFDLSELPPDEPEP